MAEVVVGGLGGVLGGLVLAFLLAFRLEGVGGHFCVPVQLEEHLSRVAAVDGVAGVVFNSGVKVVQSFLVSAQICQGQAFVALGCGVVGVDAYCLVELVQGVVVVVLLEPHAAQEVLG